MTAAYLEIRKEGQMKKKAILTTFLLPMSLLLAGGLAAGSERPVGHAATGYLLPAAQFTADELGTREKWEDFLRTAKVIGREQLTGSRAVTNPWVLTLQQDDITHKAIWKNASGLMHGYWEGWQYEIAAYLLDKHLGLGMVPPTVEKEFDANKGSCQLWVEKCITLDEKNKKKLKTPPIKLFGYNRAIYLQRFFDNLIANEDRHANQILITEDWRMILIDHSRSFRTSSKFTKGLIYTERHPEGPKLMSELPRTVVEKAKALDFDTIRSVVGKYLNDKEINAVLLRRDLILKEIDRLIAKNGEEKVLY
jgi:hypothetical protein